MTVVLLQVEEIVPAGSLRPDEVHLSGVFVKAIYKCNSAKIIERLTLTYPVATDKDAVVDKEAAVRNRIVKRAAMELKDNTAVNLGIGIPTLATAVSYM